MNADVYRMISESAWTLVLWWAFWQIVGYAADEATARAAADWNNVSRERDPATEAIAEAERPQPVATTDTLRAMREAFQAEMRKLFPENEASKNREFIVAVMPEGGEVYALLQAGSPYVVVTRPDGTRVMLDRTEEAVPYNGGLAVVFRVGV